LEKYLATGIWHVSSIELVGTEVHLNYDHTMPSSNMVNTICHQVQHNGGAIVPPSSM
jgi:hypothetical protein